MLGVVTTAVGSVVASIAGLELECGNDCGTVTDGSLLLIERIGNTAHLAYICEPCSEALYPEMRDGAVWLVLK